MVAAVLLALVSLSDEGPRRPAALAQLGDVVVVANERSGSLSLVHLDQRQLIGEIPLGKALTDVDASPDQSELWVVDRGAHQLLRVRSSGGSWETRQRLDMPFSPTVLSVADSGHQAAVSCCWSRQVVVLSTRADDGNAEWNFAVRHHVSLPFAPREMLFLDEQSLLVADAFAGRLAVLDATSGKIRAVLDTGGQNLRGLALSHDRQQVWITLQRMNSYRPTTHEDVFWGGVLQNLMLEIPVASLLAAKTDDDLEEQLYYLGRPNEAAGDPDQLLTTTEGLTCIALAGVHQVAIRTRPDAPFEQRRVGRRPVDMLLDKTRHVLVIACQMDDALSFIDLHSLQVTDQIALHEPSAPATWTAADRGEAWFYDATLSLDGWYSCNSCHVDGHSSGQLNDNFGDNTTGAPKRVLSLLGTADTAPWAWTGGSTSLEQQLDKSLKLTMQNPDADALIVSELAAYVRSLPPPPAGTVLERRDEAAVDRGQRIFVREGCQDCHQGPTYTSADSYDVGLQDQLGHRRFNPPSLRGLAHRDAYFHDNRGQSLTDVLQQHPQPDHDSLPADEVADLLTFLKSL